MIFVTIDYFEGAGQSILNFEGAFTIGFRIAELIQGTGVLPNCGGKQVLK
jgi:hypothetical protein